MRYTNKSGYGWIWDGGVGADAGGGWVDSGRERRRERFETHSSSVGIIGIAARRHASQSLHNPG